MFCFSFETFIWERDCSAAVHPPLFVPLIRVAATEHGADTRQAVLGQEKRRKEVIRKVCGPSRGSKQIEASIYKLTLSTPVLSSINKILWEAPTQLIR